MSIEITTSAPCPNDCNLCPQDILRKSYSGKHSLSLGDFMQVVDKIPKEVGITFSGFSEPFLNPFTLDMMEYAKVKGHKIAVYTTLVGFNPDDAQWLGKLSPDLFVLHLPDDLGNFHPKMTETYREAVFQVLNHVNVNMFSVMNSSFPDNGRAGYTEATDHRYGFFQCTYLENHIFVMLPNCDAVLCCMDYGLRHRLGNLLETSYQDIVESRQYRMIQRNRMMLDGDILCRSCKCAYNPVFYLLMKAERSLKKTALRFYSKDSKIREKLIEENTSKTMVQR